MSLRMTLFSASAIFALVTATAVVAEDVDLPEAPGRAQVVESCVQCHGLDVLAQRRSPDDWSQVLSRMIGNGASMTDEQYTIVLTYLSENLANPAEAPTAGSVLPP